MEILAEILAGLLFSFLEFLLQLAFSLLVDLGFHSLKQTTVKREERNPILAGIGYALLGLICGGVSLLIFPEAIVRSGRFHGVNVLVAPAMAGLGMAGLGWLLERSGKRRLRMDSFAYGFIFALPMALVRFYFTD
jgi:hypothetical protein